MVSLFNAKEVPVARRRRWPWVLAVAAALGVSAWVFPDLVPEFIRNVLHL